MYQASFNNILKNLEEMVEVQRSVRHIDGWLHDIEGIALYQAAAYGPAKGQIVEVGSFKGKSTIWLAKGSERTSREQVYAIDTHLGSPEHQPGGAYASHMPAEGTTESIFRSNIANAAVADRIVPIVLPSRVAAATWRESIRLLFIDAAHDYESVRDDFIIWQKHVVVGGLVVLHDVDKPNDSTKLDGPSKVVYQDIARTADYSEPTLVNHLAFVTKLR